MNSIFIFVLVSVFLLQYFLIILLQLCEVCEVECYVCKIGLKGALSSCSYVRRLSFRNIGDTHLRSYCL